MIAKLDSGKEVDLVIPPDGVEQELGKIGENIYHT